MFSSKPQPVKTTKYLFLASGLYVLALLLSYGSYGLSQFAAFLYGGLPFLGGGDSSPLTLTLAIIAYYIRFVFFFLGALFILIRIKYIRWVKLTTVALFVITPFLMLFVLGKIETVLFEMGSKRRTLKFQNSLCKNPNGENTGTQNYQGEQLVVTVSCKNGQFHGNYNVYYKNGNKQTETEYKNGIRDGLSHRFNVDGTLASTIEYHPEKDSLFSVDDGKTNKVIYMQPYEQQGFSYELEQQDSNCKNRNGINETNYASGDLFKRFTCVEGKYHGLFEEFYATGQLSSRLEYMHGKKHGLWQAYFVSGELEREGRYVDNNEVGVFKIFDINGKVTSQTTY